MTNSVDCDVDVARLMQRVNAEVSKRGAGALSQAGPMERPAPVNPETPYGTTIQSALPKDAPPPAAIDLTLPSWSALPARSAMEPLADGRYAVDDVLSHEDREFVHAAYHTVLRRAPDADGLDTYLTLLRRGVSKIDILEFLDRSSEGRSTGAEIKGLAKLSFVAKMGRWPFIGPVIRAIAATRNLENSERRQRALHGRIFALLEEGRNQARTFQESATQALRDLANAHSELARYAASRPGYEAIGQIASTAQFAHRAVNALQILNDKKADRAEVRLLLEAVRDSVQALERGKADASETRRMNASLDETRRAVELLGRPDRNIDSVKELLANCIGRVETMPSRDEIFVQVQEAREALMQVIVGLEESKADRASFEAVANSMQLLERDKADARDVYALGSALDETIRTVTSHADTKVDAVALNDMRCNVTAELEKKPDRDEVVKAIRAGRDVAEGLIADLGDAKADRASVDGAQQVLINMLGAKAERHEVADAVKHLLGLIQDRITRDDAALLEASMIESVRVVAASKGDVDVMNEMKAALEEAKSELNSLGSSKADNDSLNIARQDLRTGLQTKMGREEARAEMQEERTAVMQVIASLAESKADRAALEGAHQFIINQLGSKAERTEIVDSTNRLVDLIQARMTREELESLQMTMREQMRAVSDLLNCSKVDVGEFNEARRDLDAKLEARPERAEILENILTAQNATMSAVTAFGESKADRASLEEARQAVMEALATKAEGYALTDITNHLVNLVQSRTTRDEVALLEHSLVQRIDAVSELKADRTQLAAATKDLVGASDDIRRETSRLVDVAVRGLRENINSAAGLKMDNAAFDIAKADYKLALQDEVKRFSVQTRDLKRSLVDQERRLALLLEEARKRLPALIAGDQIEAMVREEDHILDALYASFEDVFRGTREDIKHRQSIYVADVRIANAGSSSAPIIDIGCGRGEWLEVLQGEGLHGRGADVNRVFLAGCRHRKLDVTEMDGASFLRTFAANSVGAVTSFHLVEHLELKAVIALVDAALHVLRPDGIVILETPNPRNVLVGSCTFYLDPTHRHPLPPELLQYILEARGFIDIQVRELHPKRPENPVASGSPIVDDTLNRFFYSAQDYAVIGRKA
jgi:SAM-dependent methyltransferase